MEKERSGLEEGLVLSSDAAEVAQCFEVWVSFGRG